MKAMVLGADWGSTIQGDGHKFGFRLNQFFIILYLYVVADLDNGIVRWTGLNESSPARGFGPYHGTNRDQFDQVKRLETRMRVGKFERHSWKRRFFFQGPRQYV